MKDDEKETEEILESSSDSDNETDTENVENAKDVESSENIENSENNADREKAEDIDKVVALEKKVSDYLERYQRTLAEFDNFRKRTLKEKAGMYNDGVRDSVTKLIPVIDNLERAVCSVSDEEKESGLYKGIEMVLKQFIEILETLGVKEIEAEGKTFDPNLHNAVMHVDDEAFGENQVAAVMQKGYICKDKVIRPSMVKVAN